MGAAVVLPAQRASRTWLLPPFHKPQRQFIHLRAHAYGPVTGCFAHFPLTGRSHPRTWR
ncbi:hypothetical protein E5161_18145 [Cohnella pontilimi]|uniref:Uncharacterized protein n=1 Tax=Cohnella pontilimi TaxID=2564100 RepID=A0A4U0F5L2_9BACL|nr:hypothetical protein E5161_18145 [Cohnella pontilimi]